MDDKRQIEFKIVSIRLGWELHFTVDLDYALSRVVGLGKEDDEYDIPHADDALLLIRPDSEVNRVHRNIAVSR